jgi:oligopeptidase A
VTTATVPAAGSQIPSDVEASLRAMFDRLHVMLTGPLSTQDLVEILAIYNNVSYLFLYLEANDDIENYDRYLPWKDKFFNSTELDRKLLAAATMLQCDDQEAEDSRRAFIKQLNEKLDPSGGSVQDKLDGHLAAAREIMSLVRREQTQLLEKLGATASQQNPAVAFYRLMSSTPNAATRTKLAKAWTRQRDLHTPAFAGVIDQMVDVRRWAATAAGYPTVLDQTLQRCCISKTDAADFLDRYLRLAIAGFAGLMDEIQGIVDVVDDPVTHFEFALNSVFGTTKSPLFVLDECIEYIFAVARSVFGLTAERIQGGSPDLIKMTISAGDHQVGEVDFDLWGSPRREIGANYTLGIRNRSEWNGLIQKPIAYVCCRFQPDDAGLRRITFQNVHSLFHEFGHALNHLLIRKRIANQSGLEYLPIERLEYLSMWFEKWAYHPSFTQFLRLSDQDGDGLARCQQIKLIEYRRTYLERAVTAALDFELHASDKAGLADALELVCAKYQVAGQCRLGDFPVYFTWPMFMANPGSNFAYLLGAADSCAKFEPFQSLRLEDIAQDPTLKNMFEPCFRFDAPTLLPDPAAVFRFYDRATLHPGEAKAE